MKKTCCAFGHRDLINNIDYKLNKILETLIKKYKVEIFYTGGMGNTDDRFSFVVRNLKLKYPHIKLILVIPYFLNTGDKGKDFYDAMFDGVILPDEIRGCYYKSAIPKRNKWIVENSDYIIDCTFRNYGGAYTAVTYGKKLNKTIIKVKG